MTYNPNDPNSAPPLFSAETEKLVRTMLKDGKVGPKFLRLLKEANPDAVIPIVDAEDKINAVREDADKRVGEALHEVGKLRAELNIKEQRASLLSSGLEQKDVDDIEKLMQEKGITDYTVAANAFRYARQLASPTPQINMQRKPITGDVPKEIMEAAGKGDMSGLDQWAREGAYADINAAKQAQTNAR